MTSDSVKIGYLEFGSKNNIPLIFVHGGPGSNSKDFIHIAESIKTKFHVFLYDQRGCGLSERNIENKKISFNKMISDLKEFQEHIGIENAAILGHSFGGAIAQEYCILNFS